MFRIDLHIQRDRLDQPLRVQRGEHVRTECVAIVDAAQYAGDVVQVRGVSPLRQEHRLTLHRGHARMIKIHVQHRFLAERAIDVAVLEADQERPFCCGPGQVGGIPVPVLQEQILMLLEPEQRYRLPGAAVGIATQEDGIFPLQFGELARIGRQHAHRVAEFGPEAGGHAQVVVGDVVEHFVSRHGVVPSQQEP
jgi:hypothetical protein